MTKLSGWEAAVIKHTSTWLPWQQQALVIGVLGLAALLMVLAWIYHLKHPRLTFGQAYLLSMGLVAVEFFLNTWITRYSKVRGVFLAGQLAMISIVSGILVLAVLLLTVFRSEERDRFDWSAAGGLALVLAGAVLLLRHRNF